MDKTEKIVTSYSVKVQKLLEVFGYKPEDMVTDFSLQVAAVGCLTVTVTKYVTGEELDKVNQILDEDINQKKDDHVL